MENTLEEILAENSSNLARGINLQNQIPCRINPKKSIPRHITIKLLKTKDRKNLESHQKKKKKKTDTLPIVGKQSE